MCVHSLLSDDVLYNYNSYNYYYYYYYHHYFLFNWPAFQYYSTLGWVHKGEHLGTGAAYAIAGPSVHPSVTRLDQSKMVEVKIMQF